MRDVAFMYGLVAGVILSIVVGWLWSLYRAWVKKRDAFHKPQAVVQTTKQTPADVYRESLGAQSKILLVQILFVAIVWVLIEILFPELARQMRLMFTSFLRNLFG